MGCAWKVRHGSKSLTRKIHEHVKMFISALLKVGYVSIFNSTNLNLDIHVKIKAKFDDIIEASVLIPKTEIKFDIRNLELRRYNQIYH